MSKLAARRAVLRWTWRLVRRDWRQQAMVLALVTFSVAACTFATIAAFHLPTLPAASLGRADNRILLTSSDPAALVDVSRQLTGQFGPLETISHTSVPVPGSVDTIDVRAQNPDLPLGAPMLALREGRYPTAPSEVAVTDGAASTLGVPVGGTISVGGGQRTVVGLVENPADFGDEFVLASPSAIDRPESLVFLVAGHRGELGDHSGTIRQLPVADERVTALADTGPSADQGAVALAMLMLDTVALLLVSLVAGAAFVVVAQRRIRQLGMFAAMGATKAQQRLAMVSHGFVVGVITVVLGNTIALAAWFAASSRVESIARHRIDPADVPLGLVLVITLLAVATTTAAAWWPARTIARVPVVRALSGRPPAPTQVHRSAAVAVAFLVLGCVILAVGIDSNGDASPWVAIGGPIAIVVGVLFLCPLAIRTLAPLARRMPVASRLALRDLTRYQARATGALAAISLGLGIACTAIIVSAAAEPPASGGNLSSRQLLFRLSTDPFVLPSVPAGTLERLDESVTRFAEAIGADVDRLDAVVGTGARASGKPVVREPSFGPGGLAVVLVGDRVDHGVSIDDPNPPYVATSDLLRHTGIDPATVGPGVEVVSSRTAPLVFLDQVKPLGRDPDELPEIGSVVRYDGPGYSDVPSTFITPAAVESHGWTTTRAGWFVQAAHPLTAAQRAEARELAAAAGGVVLTRDQHDGLAITRSVATAAGILLTLAILAMTIGLIRGEAQRDLQTLTATGASSATRRTITATTAAALALLGGLLGLTGAYTALVAGFSDDLEPLTRVPTVSLLSILVGLPLLAAAGGWLFAGRQPPAIARQALE